MAIDGPIGVGVGVFVAIVCGSFLGVFWHRCVFWHSCVCSCAGGGWLLSTETVIARCTQVQYPSMYSTPTWVTLLP